MTAVVAYHAEVSWMPGGFLGVEVFFVLSGFLISSLLRDEFERAGRVDLWRFFARRARRLFPAVWTLLLVVLAVGALALPELLWQYRSESLAALAYFTNWYQLLEAQSYFDHTGRPSLLRHLWSLAIEEQFYLLWPLCLWGLLALGGRATARFGACALACGSVLWSLALHDPMSEGSQVYLHSGARAAGLLVGAALSLSSRRRPALEYLRPISLELAGMLVLGFLIAACVCVDESHPRLYTGVLWSVDVASVIVIAWLVHPSAPSARALLGGSLLVWLGKRSYSLYLWHWPVFALTRPGLDVQLPLAAALVLRVVLSMILAELSYRCIEEPVRRADMAALWSRLWHVHSTRRLAALASVALALLLVAIPLGHAVVRAQRPAQPHWQRELEASDPSSPRGAAFVAIDSAGAHLDLVETTAPESSADLTPMRRGVPAGVVPPEPGPARADPLSPVHSSRAKPRGRVVDESAFVRERDRPPDVLAVGDSVMLGASRALRRIHSDVVVDARVARAAVHAIERLEARADAGMVGRSVVIHIGNNLLVREAQLERMFALVGGAQRVLLVTVRVPRRWETPNNEVLRAGALRHARVELVDWHAASEGHPEYFREDGYHLTGAGARAYARLLRDHL